MTIKEIQKERILCKKENPIRSGALEGLLDRAKKLAKDENREVTEKDIVAAATVLKKENMKTIATLRDDFSEKSEKIVNQYFAEIEVYKEFLPVMVSEKELTKTIGEFIDTLELPSPKAMGQVMKMVKYTFGDKVDSAMASKITRELLV